MISFPFLLSLFSTAQAQTSEPPAETSQTSGSGGGDSGGATRGVLEKTGSEVLGDTALKGTTKEALEAILEAILEAMPEGPLKGPLKEALEAMMVETPEAMMVETPEAMMEKPVGEILVEISEEIWNDAVSATPLGEAVNKVQDIISEMTTGGVLEKTGRGVLEKTGSEVLGDTALKGTTKEALEAILEAILEAMPEGPLKGPLKEALEAMMVETPEAMMVETPEAMMEKPVGEILVEISEEIWNDAVLATPLGEAVNKVQDIISEMTTGGAAEGKPEVNQPLSGGGGSKGTEIAQTSEPPLETDPDKPTTEVDQTLSGGGGSKETEVEALEKIRNEEVLGEMVDEALDEILDEALEGEALGREVWEEKVRERALGKVLGKMHGEIGKGTLDEIQEAISKRTAVTISKEIAKTPKPPPGTDPDKPTTKVDQTLSGGGASGTAASVVTAVGTFLAKLRNIVVAHPCVFVATTAGVLLMIYTVRRISKLKAKLANVENELEEVSENLANAEHVQAYLEANLANAKHAKKHLEAKLAKANELIENARHGARMQRV